MRVDVNVRVMAAVVALAVLPGTALAQSAPDGDNAPSESHLVATGHVLAGAIAGLAIHEGAHIALGLALGASPGLKGIRYGGIPFFAITHDTVSAPKEFAISSAGFWAQHASSEFLLMRHPRLRDERAPVLKGLLAFNVLASVVYAGAALARTGPDERDTRGIAVSARMPEPWVAPVILTPALLDAARYFNPDSRVVKWASRAAKVGGVALILRARR